MAHLISSLVSSRTQKITHSLSSRLISLSLVSSFISHHLSSSLVHLSPSCLISSHPSHLISIHLISSHLISSSFVSHLSSLFTLELIIHLSSFFTLEQICVSPARMLCVCWEGEGGDAPSGPRSVCVITYGRAPAALRVSASALVARPARTHKTLGRHQSQAW